MSIELLARPVKTEQPSQNEKPSWKLDLDPSEVDAHIKDIQSGNQEKIANGLRALKTLTADFIRAKAYYAKNRLRRADALEIRDSLDFYIYQVAADHKIGSGNFAKELESKIDQELGIYVRQERVHQSKTSAFTDEEAKIGGSDGDANYDDFLHDMHAPPPDVIHEDDIFIQRASNIQAADIVDSNSDNVADAADKEGFRQASDLDGKPIWGMDFPVEDHLIYHLGGILSREEMVFYDLINALTTKNEMSRQELAERFEIAEDSVYARKSAIRKKLLPFKEDLEEGRVPQGASKAKGDPIYHLATLSTANNKIVLDKDIHLLPAAYALLPADLKSHADIVRGVGDDYGIPASPRRIKSQLRISAAAVTGLNRRVALKLQNNVELLKTLQGLEDEDHPYWLMKPSEIENLFAKLDSGKLTIPAALGEATVAAGHQRYRAEIEPKNISSEQEIVDLIQSKDTTYRVVDRKTAIQHLAAALKTDKNSPLGQALRLSPKFFEALLQRSGSKKIKALRSARKYEDEGELTYERLENIFKRYALPRSYQTLVKFVSDNNLNIHPVHSPLDKPRLIREILKEAKKLEARAALSFDSMKAIITQVTGEEFTDQTIYRFIDKHGLRKQAQIRDMKDRAYMNEDQEKQVAELAQPLSKKGLLDTDMLNDFVEQVTGNRYANPHNSLPPFIDKYKLRCQIIYPKGAAYMPSAVETDRKRPEKLNLGEQHLLDIKDMAGKLAEKNLLTRSRLNRIIHDESGRSFERKKSIENFAKKQDLPLVAEPKTIFHDFDRGLDKGIAFRELGLEIGCKHNDLFQRGKKANFNKDRILEKLLTSAEPDLEGLEMTKFTKAHVLSHALAQEDKSKLGRLLRTAGNYHLFIANMS